MILQARGHWAPDFAAGWVKLYSQGTARRGAVAHRLVVQGQSRRGDLTKGGGPVLFGAE